VPELNKWLIAWVLDADRLMLVVGSTATGRGAVSIVAQCPARTVAAKMKARASSRVAESSIAGPDNKEGKCGRSIFTSRKYTTHSMTLTF
jgi:hypothetical protein